MYKCNNSSHSSCTQYLSLANLHRAAAHKKQECYLPGIKKQPVFYAQIAQQHYNEDLSEGDLLNGANQQRHDAAPPCDFKQQAAIVN